MAIPFIGTIIEQGMNLIDSIGDKIAPDQNIKLQTEADIKKFTDKLRVDFKLSVMDKMLQKGTAENEAILEDIQGARQHEIDLAKMEPPAVRYITGLLRGIFRPVVGFGILGSFAWCRFLAPCFGSTQITLNQWDYGVIMLIVTFYFGGRTIEKIKNAHSSSAQLVKTVE